MNHYKATIILIIVTIGFLITYPFHSSFIGGLLSSGFCAAMIGGFADWFGVHALFRKPFGIPFGTEIIPKNREKIFNALSDMVGNEFLTKDNLKRLLDMNSFSKLILQILKDDAEKNNLKTISDDIVLDVLEKINPEEVGQIITGIAEENISKIQLSPYIVSAIELSMKSGLNTKIINFIIDELVHLSKTKQVRLLITTLVKETLASYESDKKRRKFVNKIVFDMLLQMSPSDISAIIQDRLARLLTELKSPSNPMKTKLTDFINTKILELRTNEEFSATIENWKNEQLTNRLDIPALLSDHIKQYTEKNSSSVTSFVNNQLDKLLINFEANSKWQNNFDLLIKEKLVQFIDNNQGEIAVLVKENLDKYSNTMLINLIESKAGNDLQMIRINGSIVGGLVGILIFVMTFWI